MSLADAEGLDKLSMRRLGKAVGVEAMSLYNHVANKDDLFDGMVEAIVRAIEVPRPEDDWRTGMRRRAESARAVFNAHPWALLLIESRTNPSLAQLRYYEATLACMRRDGFSVQAAAHAFALLDAFLFGFCLQEQTLPIDDSNVGEVAAQITAELPMDDFPHFAEMVGHALSPGYTYSAEFKVGLELILDGLERLREPV